MDSITQIVLGAAIGELIAGRKLGHRAALWGAIGGTLPDLDVLTALFLNPVDYLAAHRGFSHSVFFAFLIAPLLAIVPSNIYKSLPGNYKNWLKILFWSIFTHPLLDTFTGYGTQLLNPFSDIAFEINSIFIIDPIYTISLLFFLIISMRTPISKPKRQKWIKLGLTISTVYLFLTLGLKLIAHQHIKDSASAAGIEMIRMMSIPGPFSSILWRGLIETDDGFYQTYYSVFDDKNQELIFHFLPHSRHKLDPIRDSIAAQRLEWFSKGFYTVRTMDESYILNDLRFGSFRGWVGEHDLYVFSFLIYQNELKSYTFTQIQNPIDIKKADFVSLFNRTFSVDNAAEEELGSNSISDFSN
jgi:inner membrane protein